MNLQLSLGGQRRSPGPGWAHMLQSTDLQGSGGRWPLLGQLAFLHMVPHPGRPPRLGRVPEQEGAPRPLEAQALNWHTATSTPYWPQQVKGWGK